MELTERQIAAFWAKVAKTDSCWLWTGCKDGGGYGMQTIGRKVSSRAHRISWVIHGNDIPSGHVVYQTCHNHACVRPDHLAMDTKGGHIAHRNRTEDRVRPPLEDLFWSKVNKDGPVHPVHGTCWVWTAALRDHGYGGSWNGTRADKAHRVSWRLTNGEIPDGLNVLHKCDNRLCVRPEHLFLGTHRDNARDKEAKGRGNHPIGSEVWKAKLVEDQVLEIRQLLDTGEYLQREIAEMFGMSKPMISAINTRRNWSHI